MAGMTNPAIKNLESRMSELEREMSDLEKLNQKKQLLMLHQKIYQKKRMLLIYKKKKRKILQM